MSRVPRIRFKGFEEDWEQRKLGEICQITMGQSPDGSTYSQIPLDYILVQGNADLKDGWVYPRIWTTQKTKMAEAGDLIMSVRAPAGTMGKTYYDVVIGRGVAGIKGSEFIYQALVKMDSNGYWKVLASGSTFESINSDVVNGAELMVTENIDEQNKIGDYLASIDYLITLHQRKLEKLKIIKKSMLENLFPQNVEKTPKIRFSGFTEDWEQRKLGEVANRFDSTRVPISENLRVSGNTPYYGANGIQDYVDGYTHDGEYVLIAEDGANDLKNYPIRLVKGRIWVNNHAHVIQGIEKSMNNQFINFAMTQVDFESIVVGCGRAKLNAEQLMNICFKVPNKNEQANIGRLVESLNNLITLHQSKLDKLQKIKKSMLESMFV